jgi:hypothetical protein
METQTQDQPTNVAPPKTEGGSAATTGSALRRWRITINEIGRPQSNVACESTKDMLEALAVGVSVLDARTIIINRLPNGERSDATRSLPRIVGR